jgi:hypothetical protein
MSALVSSRWHLGVCDMFLIPSWRRDSVVFQSSVLVNMVFAHCQVYRYYVEASGFWCMFLSVSCWNKLIKKVVCISLIQRGLGGSSHSKKNVTIQGYMFAMDGEKTLLHCSLYMRKAVCFCGDVSVETMCAITVGRTIAALQQFYQLRCYESWCSLLRGLFPFFWFFIYVHH